MHDGRGYFARQWFDINALTAEERVEYDAEPMPDLPPDMCEMYDAQDAYYENRTPRFASIDDAVTWAGLQDAYSNIDADMRAFNAPSECATDAYRGLERRIEEHEAKAMNIEDPRCATQPTTSAHHDDNPT